MRTFRGTSSALFGVAAILWLSTPCWSQVPGAPAKDAAEPAAGASKGAAPGAREPAKGAVQDVQREAKEAAGQAREAERDAVKGGRGAPRGAREAAEDAVEETRRDAADAVRGARRDVRKAGEAARDGRRTVRSSRELSAENVRAADLGLWFSSRASADGLVIADVAAEGAIAKIGFEEGDRIVSINGTPVRSEAEFTRLLLADDIRNERVKIIVLRDRREQILYVQPAIIFEEIVSYDPLWQYGLVIDDRYPDRIVILRVYPRTPAYYAGLRAGDVITSFQGRRITTVQDLVRGFSEADGNVALQVNRGDRTRELEVDTSSALEGETRAALRPRVDAETEPSVEGRAKARSEERIDRRTEGRVERRTEGRDAGQKDDPADSPPRLDKSKSGTQPKGKTEAPDEVPSAEKPSAKTPPAETPAAEVPRAETPSSSKTETPAHSPKGSGAPKSPREPRP